MARDNNIRGQENQPSWGMGHVPGGSSVVERCLPVRVGMNSGQVALHAARRVTSWRVAAVKATVLAKPLNLPCGSPPLLIWSSIFLAVWLATWIFRAQPRAAGTAWTSQFSARRLPMYLPASPEYSQ
ncbi:conserved hypothetical protein [Coccidioides posadasii str. Silveira]|uniref:Uncharacterized protein n=2 Tax=Coccidioides posadasii TaxID=199306 RepID=E9DCQ9_COCPS|nr:conserved hypothetical protein [Coccidioides posadasii str. Silveira]KMM69293.1 hypothetical protein CPAG_05614 [Coccidioides posadasii RMSCC 3488]